MPRSRLRALDLLETTQYVSADQELPVGVPTPLAVTPRAVTAGRMYRYKTELQLFNVSAANSIISCGAFRTTGGAASSVHDRNIIRQTITSAAYGGTNDPALTSAPAGQTIPYNVGNPTMLRIEGTFRCTNSGTVVPTFLLTTSPLTVRAGSFFYLEDIGPVTP